MKEETARGAAMELRERLRDVRKWGSVHAETDEHQRYRRHTVRVSRKHDLSRQFDLPDELVAYAASNDLTIRVDATDDRAELILDDGELEKIEVPPDEQARADRVREFRREFDLTRPAAEALADEYDSVDEVVSASRTELEEIDGVGGRRASKILHRHSDALEEALRRRSGTVVAIEDSDGILRLPREFENADLEPKYPK